MGCCRKTSTFPFVWNLELELEVNILHISNCICLTVEDGPLKSDVTKFCCKSNFAKYSASHKHSIHAKKNAVCLVFR